MIGGAYIIIQGGDSVYEYCIERCELREMYTIYTCLTLFDNRSLEGGSTGNSQNGMYVRYMLVVFHHIILVMITVIIQEKFEHMSI